MNELSFLLPKFIYERGGDRWNGKILHIVVSLPIFRFNYYLLLLF